MRLTDPKGGEAVKAAFALRPASNTGHRPRAPFARSEPQPDDRSVSRAAPERLGEWVPALIADRGGNRSRSGHSTEPVGRRDWCKLQVTDWFSGLDGRFGHDRLVLDGVNRPKRVWRRRLRWQVRSIQVIIASRRTCRRPSGDGPGRSCEGARKSIIDLLVVVGPHGDRLTTTSKLVGSVHGNVSRWRRFG